jgi:hypothetical protein
MLDSEKQFWFDCFQNIKKEGIKFDNGKKRVFYLLSVHLVPYLRK